MVEEKDMTAGASANNEGIVDRDTAIVSHQDSQNEEEQQDQEASFKQKVVALLLCPVCDETTTDPRQLNCGHFFCMECVNLLKVDEDVRCAKCAKNTPVTDAGLRVDDLASKLVVLVSQYGPPTRRVYVDDDELKAAPMANGYVERKAVRQEVLEVNRDAELPPGPSTNDVEPDPVVEPTEVILQPPEDYQSPEEEDTDEPLPPPPSPPPSPSLSPTLPAQEPSPAEPVADAEVQETAREPVEHDDATETGNKIENTSEPADESLDEADRKMKASEVKPSDVAISIEMDRQCSDCHSSSCNCNNSATLLTPPVSNGSQLSVDTNTSNPPSDEGELEILVRGMTRFTVKESASHVEVANKNKIYITRWTYDDDGMVDTVNRNGDKTKFIRTGGHYNYSGVTLSKLGFVFALNTSKGRVEEYSGVDGKKVKYVKLDLCKDPHAIDIMPSGEILVVDQEKHAVIIYPNSKKTNAKPKIIKNDLIKEPNDIAATNDGFYITSAGTRSLIKMDLDGHVVWSTKKKLKEPKGVCVDESGHVYVVDNASHSIFMYTKDGDLKGKVTDKDGVAMKNPWYISVRDGIMAVLFSHNTVKTYQFV